MNETSFKVPIESLELGYFALNPMANHPKDILYRILVLNQLKLKNSWHIREIREAISKKISLPSFKLDEIVSQLADENYLMATNNNLSVTTKGRNYISGIENDISYLLCETKKSLSEYDIKEDEIDSAIEIIDFLAARDSELVASLLGINDGEHLFLETEKEALEFIGQKFPDLKAKVTKFINKNILDNSNFNRLFIFLIYGHIAEYLLLSSSNNSLSKIFANLKLQTNEIKIVLDTNAIISLICHFDHNNKIINSLLEYIVEYNIGVKYVYYNKTIDELKTTLGKMNTVASRIQYIDERAPQKLINERSPSPLKSFYYEDKYRDWDHYTYLFMNAWQSYTKYYPIDNINNALVDTTVSDIEKLAKRDSGLLIFDDSVGKKLNVLEHDISLILVAHEMAKIYEKDSVIKNVLILTFDSDFDILERNVYYLQPGLTKRSLNLRQLVAYLSPLFSLKETTLKIEDKMMYGSLIKEEKMIQSIIKSVVENTRDLGLVGLHRDSNYEALKANTTLSKETIFSRSQIENEEFI